MIEHLFFLYFAKFQILIWVFKLLEARFLNASSFTTVNVFSNVSWNNQDSQVEFDMHVPAHDLFY